jgi:predicted ATPase/DNA-binding CsgD family transcriptional regulator
LQDKRLLLVVDNFEHVMDGAPLLAHILSAAPDVKLLVTSRESLRLQEEWLRVVHGLNYPDGSEASTMEHYSAIQLFIERAQRLRGDLDFTVQAENIVRICQFVEGMPLALELAAGWVKTLSCREIVDELWQNQAILVARTNNVPDRHRSMQVVFDHSWRLLTENERAILQCFVVFRGGCTREAAAQVAGATLPLLAGLVDKSLLRHAPDTGRYDMHELLRQYAAEHLNQTPKVREKVLDRHYNYYTEFLYQLKTTIHLINQSEVIRDIDNFRIAWKRAIQQRNPAALERAASSLYWLYHIQGWQDEGTAMFYLAEEAVRGMPATEDNRYLLGMMRLLRGFYGPEEPEQALYPPVDIEATLTLWDGLEERPEMGLPLSRALLRLLKDLRSPVQVMAIAQKSLTFSRNHHDLSGVAIALTTLAAMHFEALGEFSQALPLLEEALEIDRQIGFDLNARWSEGILGSIAYLQGDYEAAREHMQASVAHCYAGGIFNRLDMTLFALAHVTLELGDYAAARAHFEESIKVASSFQRPFCVAKSQAGLGILAAVQGDSSTAAAYYEASHADFQLGSKEALNYKQDMESFGLLALLLGHHQQALDYYEVILSHYAPSGYRVPLMYAYCRIGHALIGLANEPMAERYLFDALREATAMGARQIALEALFGIAQLSVVSRLLALDLLMLIIHHEVSNHFSRTGAKHVLAGMETSFTQAEFADAIERGQALNLETAAALVKPFGMAQARLNQPLLDPLSPRELDVLALVAEGLTNQEIADRLYIGVSTVKKHINRIYSKLGVTHRAQAVAAERRMKILP